MDPKKIADMPNIATSAGSSNALTRETPVAAVVSTTAPVARRVPYGSSGVTAVTRTDAGRVCTFADGRIQDEQILDYSTETYFYR